MIDVRGIEPAEVPAAVALIVEGSLSPGGERPDDLDAYWRAVLEVRDRGGEVLVAVDDGEVLGVCQVLIFSHFQHAGGRCCEVESVFVRGDQRGRGIGSMLLREAEGLARAAGCYRIQLTSRNPRLDAHRFYRALGFEQMSQGFKKTLA